MPTFTTNLKFLIYYYANYEGSTTFQSYCACSRLSRVTPISFWNRGFYWSVTGKSEGSGNEIGLKEESCTGIFSRTWSGFLLCNLQHVACRDIRLNATLKGLLFKAQIKGFKLIANKYRILRLGKSIYLTLNWLGFSVLPLGGWNVVMKVTTRRGAKHANAENTVIATVFAARISVKRLCDTASSRVLMRLYCLMEIVKIHACETSIMPLGKKTASDIKTRKWGTMGSNWLSSGIMLCWMQPCINWISALPSSCWMR